MEFFPEILPVKTAQDTAQRPDAQKPFSSRRYLLLIQNAKCKTGNTSLIGVHLCNQ